MTMIRFKLFMFPMFQFAMQSFLTIFILNQNMIWAVMTAFAMQQVWWNNVRNHRLTDETDPWASTIYASGAAMGVAISLSPFYWPFA